MDLKEALVIASREKLRFQSTKGQVTTEDLWDLKLEELDTMAQALDAKLSSKQSKSFLKQTRATKEDKLDEIRFHLIIVVINTRQEEAKILRERELRRNEKRVIDEIIAKKEGEALENSDLEELEAKAAALEAQLKG